MMTVGVLTGLLCGVAAYAFKASITMVAGLFTPHIRNGEINWWIVLLPVAGIVLTGIFTRYIVKTNLSHGVGQLLNDLHNKTYRLRHNIVFSPIVGGTLTLGMGGSSGAEGPIAYAGAAIGSNLGQLLGLDRPMLHNLIACGASAGIAGIFSAPMGGLLFSIELLQIEISVQAMTAAAAACLASYLTVFSLHGNRPDMILSPLSDYVPEMLPMVLLLGVFCGLYSLYYSYVTGHLDIFFKRIKSPWLRNLSGGLIVGAILVLFPSMYSVGYDVLGNIINGNYTWLARGSLFSMQEAGTGTLMIMACGILFCKCWAVASTNSSGGVGGDFAPTLFAGGVAGFLFASICNTYFSTQLPVGFFSYLGMAGAMAGIIEAPLMAIFLVMEMTQTFRYAMPVAMCALVSYLVVKTVTLLSKEHSPLIRHILWFRHGHPEKTVNSRK